MRGGETEHKKEYVPTKEECRKEVQELMSLVHGAVKARLQLGFDNVGDEVWNLKPLIRDLKDKVGVSSKPMINEITSTDPITSNKTKLGPAFTPLHNSNSIKNIGQQPPFTQGAGVRTKSMAAPGTDNEENKKI